MYIYTIKEQQNVDYILHMDSTIKIAVTPVGEYRIMRKKRIILFRVRDSLLSHK